MDKFGGSHNGSLERTPPRNNCVRRRYLHATRLNTPAAASIKLDGSGTALTDQLRMSWFSDAARKAAVNPTQALPEFRFSLVDRLSGTVRTSDPSRETVIVP